MKYIAYNRKSTDEAGNQIFSLETQRAITNDIAQGSGLEVIETIQEARSAKIAGNRPAFTSMLVRIRDGEAEGIIVAHLDRLTRNERELADLIELFQSNALKEVRTKYKIYSSVDDLYYMGIDLIGAAQFSRKLSVRVKEGMLTKVQRGEYPSRAPIGYKNITSGIIPDERFSSFVQLAYTEYATGNYSLKQLTQFLYERGLRTRYAGQKVYLSVVHEILTNPAYYGMIRGKKQLYKGIHTPLVSKALFDRVQDILHNKNKSRFQKHHFLYRGYLRCGKCGCCLTATIKKEKYIYYYCTNAKGICDQHFRYISEGRIYELLRDQFAQFSLTGGIAFEALRVYSESLVNSKDSTIALREQMEGRVRAITSEQDNLVKLNIKGKIPEEQFNRLSKELNDEKLSLEVQLSGIKPQNPRVTLELLEKVKKEAPELQKMFSEGDDAVKSDLLKSVLWNCDVINGEITSQRYKLPWAYMENPLKTGNFQDWYP